MIFAKFKIHQIFSANFDNKFRGDKIVVLPLIWTKKIKNALMQPNSEIA
jgi:hypothetical protein